MIFVFFFFLIFIFTLFYFTILYWFCHTLTWIHHGCTCDPKHIPPSHHSPHNIPLGHPHAPAPSMLYPSSDIDWWFDSCMIVYMFQCHSPKSSHPLPLQVQKISGSSAFSKTSLNIREFTVHILLKPDLENFEHYFANVWDEYNCAIVWAFFGIAFLWDWNKNWPLCKRLPLLCLPLPLCVLIIISIKWLEFVTGGERLVI